MANSVLRSAIFFGKVLTTDLPQAIKVNIAKYVMDPRLTMYFNEKTEVYAFDKKKECSEGDYVIIRKLPDDGVPCEGRKIEYDVEKLVYKQKEWVDPLSGKRNAGIEFLDDIERTCKLFGCQRPYFKVDDKLE